MMKRNLAFAALAVLMTSSAFATESFEPSWRPGGHWRCERAERNLRQCEHAFQLAADQLSRANQICGGAPACIYAAQNHYNETLVMLQNAQNEYNRACY